MTPSIFICITSSDNMYLYFFLYFRLLIHGLNLISVNVPIGPSGKLADMVLPFAMLLTVRVLSSAFCYT